MPFPHPANLGPQTQHLQKKLYHKHIYAQSLCTVIHQLLQSTLPVQILLQRPPEDGGWAGAGDRPSRTVRT